jgi:hypothetical protein
MCYNICYKLSHRTAVAACLCKAPNVSPGPWPVPPPAAAPAGSAGQLRQAQPQLTAPCDHNSSSSSSSSSGSGSSGSSSSTVVGEVHMCGVVWGADAAASMQKEFRSVAPGPEPTEPYSSMISSSISSRITPMQSAAASGQLLAPRKRSAACALQ